MKRPHFNLHNTILTIAKYIEDNSWVGDEYKICVLPIHKILSLNHTVLQLFEFALIGASGVGINFMVYSFMGKTDLAWIMGILVSLFSNFFLNKWLVFDSPQPSESESKDIHKPFSEETYEKVE